MSPYIATACILYLIGKKRQVDFYTIAIISTLFYFLPIFFGFTWFRDGVTDIVNPITPQMDAVYSTVFFLLLLGCILNDAVLSRPFPMTFIVSRQKQLLYYSVALFAWLIFATFHWQDLIVGRKENFGSLYSVSFTSVAIALTIAITSKSIKWACVFILLALIDTYAGNRELIAFAAMVTFILIMIKRGPVQLWVYSRSMIPILVAAFTLMTYKMISAVVILQRWDLVFARLADPDFYVMSIMRSEPFVTQSLLFSAIEEGWTFNGSVFLNISIILLPFGSIFSEDVQSLSGVINQHMGYLDYGVASNFWAESYMMGGMPMVVISALVYAAAPAAFNILFAKWRSVVIRTVVALCAITLIFFLHRAGIEYSVNIMKRFLLFALLVHCLFILMNGRAK